MNSWATTRREPKLRTWTIDVDRDGNLIAEQIGRSRNHVWTRHTVTDADVPKLERAAFRAGVEWAVRNLARKRDGSLLMPSEGIMDAAFALTHQEQDG